jgi:hypothetical protein
VTKIVIGGETFDYDGQKQPMSEALAIEEVYGARYAQWQQDLAGGSAKAYCVLAWLVWRREGRDVPFADMLSGKVDFDLGEMLKSIFPEPETEVAAEADPTEPPDPAGTRTTRQSTKASSAST